MSAKFYALLLIAIAGSMVVETSSAREIRGKPISPKTNALPVAVVTNAPTAAKTQKSGDYLQIGFDKLSNYTFAVPEGVQPTNALGQPVKSSEQIPVEVKAFDQKKVALKGFMLPLKVDEG